MYVCLQPVAESLVELQGLNERFRLCRYDVGQSFKKHCDGSFNRGHKYWSFLTLMVYLNDEFTGGKTIFYDKSNQVTHEIRPKTGLAIVFFQTSKYPHIGEEIQTGRKYILRTGNIPNWNFLTLQILCINVQKIGHRGSIGLQPSRSSINRRALRSDSIS